MREVLAQMLDGLTIHDIAVMGAMQDTFGTVQDHPDAGPRQRFHGRPQMMQKRLDFTPMDVAADRVLENGADEMLVLMAHGEEPQVKRNP